MADPAPPTWTDPTLTSASEVIGGPAGRYMRPSSWWTPVRVVVAVAAVTWMLAMVQKAPCAADQWRSNDVRYAKMCYSDMPYLYTGRGFAELVLPYSDSGGRYPDLEYPVGIGYFAYGTAVLTHLLSGWPDLAPRRNAPAGSVSGVEGVWDEAIRFVAVSAVLLGVAAIAAAGFLAAANRGRPWDALGYAAAPTLALSGLINWDVLAVLAVAMALWAWSRGRPVLSGVIIGIGTATKLYPLFLLGALLVAGIRRRQVLPVVQASVAAGLAWLVLDGPAMVLDWSHWASFWSFNSHRGADLGSIWLVLSQSGVAVDADLINKVSWIFFLVVCVGVLILGLRTRRTPRVASMAFLIVAGFLLVNKVYSPQYVLWLLPLAALARPRWRDLLIWQAGEIFYFAAVWWYLGGFTAPAGGGTDRIYWIAIFVRLAAELYLMAVVVRDALRPEHDPVRADGVTDDPLWPSAEEDAVDVGGGEPDADVDETADFWDGNVVR